MFLDGDLKALRAYHAGHRTDPRVVKYFERAELKDLAGSDCLDAHGAEIKFKRPDQPDRNKIDDRL